MAKIRSGEIDPGVPHRTGNYQRSWALEGKGAKTRITGQLPHDKWVGRLAAKIGWRNVDDILSTNYRGAIRSARSAVSTYLRKRKRK